MRNSNSVWEKFLTSSRVAIATFTTTFLICHSAGSYAAALSQQPLFASKPVIPMMMLNMSKDHQLYFKAYDDYSDLTKDGVPETTYLHSYNYYGYFDSNKCYYYDTTVNRFKPGRWANSSNYCNHAAIGSETARIGSEWSGNFLNWATMTRMDTVRKILYGGMRSTDTDTGTTVLERAFLPNDAHSFTKYYNGTDVHQLVGLASGTILNSDSTKEKNGITICNTTTAPSGLSQNVTNSPRMMVAKGNFSLWASNEVYQCRWGGGTTFNNSALSGIYAYSYSPSESTDGVGEKNYRVRVQVCDETFVDNEPTVAGVKTNNEKCLRYPNGKYKPIGLLQTYGANDSIHFGLITGSYAKNKSGGVLRKNIGTIKNEINATTGQILTPSGGNIITTMNKLRIYGYDFSNGQYNVADGCSWDDFSFVNGECTNWGNPQTEIFLESLRYYAGETKTSAFEADDSSFIAGLPAPSWSSPVTSANKCAPLNILQFNASVSSFDHDEVNGNISGISGINRTTKAAVTLDVDAQTNAVGIGEALHGKSYFIGDNNVVTGVNKGKCTAKNLVSLAETTGVCPEAPRLEASYKMAGLAYYANMYGVKSDRETVKTYGVSLQPAIPQVSVPVPETTTNQKITILPACVSQTKNANCSIVDFKISEQKFDVTLGAAAYTGTKSVLNGKKVNLGRLYVNWEDSEQGGDYDMDMWGMIDYWVAADGTIVVQTDVIHQAAGHTIGFGYIINGTNNDGIHIDSGINNYSQLGGCATTACNVNDAAVAKVFSLGTSTAESLQSPLYYAAKWGGFEREKEVYNTSAKKFETQTFTQPPKNASGVWETPETFFHSTDPRSLEAALGRSFEKIALVQGSASAVATNSTRIDGDRLVYQARFRTKNWSGQVLAYKMDVNGDVIVKNADGTSAAVWDTDKTVLFPSNHLTRKVYTYNDSTAKGVNFLWSDISAAQQALFQGTDTAVVAQKKINWLRGDTSEEGALLRRRESLIGDIVNSDPAYAGQQRFAWHRLPGTTYDSVGAVLTDPLGAATYKDYVATRKVSSARVPMLLVGANDGMLHVLNANAPKDDAGNVIDANAGKEIFSYVPRGVLDRLGQVPNTDYTSAGKHIYTMDGSVFVGDVYDATKTGSDSKWRTYAVGTLGAGGKGLFVLDLTDIDKNGNGFDPAKHIILDYSTGEIPEMGHVFNRPIIAPMKDGDWYVVFGNGVESNKGSQLILINLRTKAVKKIDTKAGTGLTGVALLPNESMVMEYAYAGDLDGNVWKFNLSDSDPTKWNVSHKSGSNPAPFAKLTRDGTTIQPITAAPTLGIRFASTGVKAATMVYVGTGRYLYNGDNVPSTSVQSFYALADEEESSGSDANIIWSTSSERDAKLHKKTIDTETASPGAIRTIKGEGRYTADTKPDWTTGQDLGWYLDFIPPSPGTAQGEMVISKSLLLYDRLVFPTLIPSDQSCSLGGKGWIMDLAAVGDRYGATHRIIPESGMELDVPVMSLSESIESGENIYIPVSNIKGEIDVVKGKTPPKAPKGRSSWRQIK